jgi:hypothetical protein
MYQLQMERVSGTWDSTPSSCQQLMELNGTLLHTVEWAWSQIDIPILEV